jgi:drug/metabolite transporter (DMT)-like permease
MNPRLLGIFLMIGAVTMFAVLDSTAKYLTGLVATPQIVFFRYAFSLAIVAALVWRNGGLALLRTDHLGLQLTRGLLLLLATATNFTAVKYLQLAQTSSISFSNPLWVCALSPLLLGEHVGPRRWAAVIVGFIGVLVIIRPGGEGFHWAMILSVVCALSAALYQIATRKVGGSDKAMTSLFYVSLSGTVAAAPIAPIGWVDPGWLAWTLLVLAAAYGSIGHFMLTEAHRLAPAPVLAPFVYTQIISMTFIGYVVFGDVPDAMTVVGSLLVVASGLYVFYREQKLKGGRG